jgi:glycerophosphoryl diester phosphodiesterase
MSNNVFIEGDIDLLIKAQKLGLTNKLFLFSALNESSINDACNNHFFGFSTSIDDLNNNVSLAHQNGLYVMAWSPNNFSQNEIALDNKVDIIQTDDPISILKLLNRYNYEYTNP